MQNAHIEARVEDRSGMRRSSRCAAHLLLLVYMLGAAAEVSAEPVEPVEPADRIEAAGSAARFEAPLSILLDENDASPNDDYEIVELFTPVFSASRIASMLFEVRRDGAFVHGLSFTEANAALAFFSDGLPSIARLLGPGAEDALLRLRFETLVSRGAAGASVRFAPVAVPEAETGVLVAAGLLVLGCRRRPLAASRLMLRSAGGGAVRGAPRHTSVAA